MYRIYWLSTAPYYRCLYTWKSVPVQFHTTAMTLNPKPLNPKPLEGDVCLQCFLYTIHTARRGLGALGSSVWVLGYECVGYCLCRTTGHKALVGEP